MKEGEERVDDQADDGEPYFSIFADQPEHSQHRSKQRRKHQQDDRDQSLRVEGCPCQRAICQCENNQKRDRND